MHYLKTCLALLAKKLRERQARQSRLRHLRNLLLLSDANLTELDVSRAEIRNRLLRLHLGAASVSRR